MRSALALLCGIAAVGCSGAREPADAATPLDVAGDAPSPPRTRGEVRVEACSSLGTGPEPCFYTFAYDPAACPDGRCARLLVYFSGGQESCPDLDPPGGYLAHYSAAGYVAVCARDFETGDGSGTFPRHLEASRLDALVRAITSDPDIARGWTGEDLLFSGVSHGASGPMIAIAQGDAARADLWRGSRYTAACFYDGTYDAPGLLRTLHDEECGGTAILSYRRAYERYCAWPSSAGLLPASWPDPASCDTADTRADTLVGAPFSAFLHDFALVECGSGLTDFCGALLRPLQPADVLPGAPIERLCSEIQASPGYTCELVSRPDTGHVQCSLDAASADDCNAWFRRRLVAEGITP